MKSLICFPRNFCVPLRSAKTFNSFSVKPNKVKSFDGARSEEVPDAFSFASFCAVFTISMSFWFHFPDLIPGFLGTETTS